jgi:hypothetical protein
MANWKRLTGQDGQAIDVNIDLVAYILTNADGFTELYFASGFSKEDGEQFVTVQDSPDQILS